jgi:glycosyltransferase involved in cell wall biosynthesis
MPPAVRGTIAVDARMISASGIGTYLSELLPRLVEARPQLNFVLLGSAATLAHLPWTQVPNVRVIDFHAPTYSIQEQIALARYIPRDSDIFWSPHYNIPLAWRGRLVVTVHDVAHLALPELFRGIHRRAYARFMFHRVRRAADAIITVSEFTRGEFERMVGSRPVKPVVVYNGVDKSWFEVPPSSALHPRPYLLYLGSLKPHKNLSRLLEAVSWLPPSTCDLLVVGKDEGVLNGDTAARAVAEGLAPRVRLLGAQPQDLLKKYVSQAKALVLPSLYEGFGLPPLEAMACGCPAVVSNAAALPEICGDAALYCDPYNTASIAEALRRVLEDPATRETLRRRGLERARHFTWERSARETLAVLEGVLAG